MIGNIATVPPSLRSQDGQGNPWISMGISMITSPLRIMIVAVLSVTVGELTPGTATAAEQGLQYTQQTNDTTP